MKKLMFRSAGIFALGTLVISLGYRLVAPVDGLGVPTAAWLRPLAYPAIWVGAHCFQWFHWSIPVCQAAGIAALTLLWALVGLAAGLAISKIRRQRGPA